MNGAQAIVKTLEHLGVTTVFGYPGGTIMPVYDALLDSHVEHVLCRHEQGAGFSAIGYSRADHKTGVCIATSGPGATNLVTALADAMMDSVPIIAITGQVSREGIGTDAFQEMDMLGLSMACTKHSFLVTDGDKLCQTLHDAFVLANEGRPGPVLVDIPKDVQLHEAQWHPPLDLVFNEFHPAKPDVDDINQALNLLRESEKPVAYIGGGVLLANAVQELRQFLNITGIPSVCTLKGLGSVKPDTPEYLGMLGMHGTQAANIAVQECDLLLAIGARFDDRVTGKLDTFAPHAKVIHIDVDSAEINKRRVAEVTLQQAMGWVLSELTEELTINKWADSCKQLSKQHAWQYDKPGEDIYAPELLKQLSQ
ncbi:MAG: thiamine pyrophosphate-binding protein, partial [Endozoicomonas sp.]